MNDSEITTNGGGSALWLGPDSPLAAALPGFSPREGQLAMAEACERTLRQGVPLVVEAATGTGKTLAYLLPCLLSGQKTIISTGTRTLQDQISAKELPLLKRALAPDLRWAVLKGRSNYLCQRRFQAFRAQPDLSLPDAAGALGFLAEWAAGSPDGDLDQVRGEGLPGSLLAEVTASSEQCLGGRCPERERCHLMEARRRAAEADLVVVNHHLFLADLRLKAEGHGEALPRYQAVVFDEAHLIPEIATAAFGISVSLARFRSLMRDLGREAAGGRELMLAAANATAKAEAFFGDLGRLLGPGDRAGLSQEALDRLAGPGEAFSQALEDLAGRLDHLGTSESEALAVRADTLALDLAAVAQPVPGQSVAWGQGGGYRAALHLSPVEVGPHLDHALHQDNGRLIFTSATCAAEGNLGPFVQRLGLGSDTHTLVVPSPFDLAHNALLYVPRRMPQPSHPGFASAVADVVMQLLEYSGGRAFVLFTSYRNLQAVSERLAPLLPYTCLVQGQAPRLRLLERFVSESPAVLFATASFWQGVDVPGAALSAVIVDKLPFSPPDDPLVAARCRRLEEEGESPFARLMVPEAILSLKQGLGRLLRTPQDRGLLAVLDVRLVTKGYGRRFLAALRPVPVTHDLERVAEFFADI